VVQLDAILFTHSSFEPGEDWFCDYEQDAMIAGAELAPPRWHPVPGPEGRVPRDWRSLAHE